MRSIDVCFVMDEGQAKGFCSHNNTHPQARCSLPLLYKREWEDRTPGELVNLTSNFTFLSLKRHPVKIDNGIAGVGDSNR